MTVTRLSPMLRTRDLACTRAFYTEVLGFSCRAFSKEWGWMALELDGLEMMFVAAGEGDAAPTLSGSIYFRTDDVEGLWSRVQGRAKVGYPPQDMPYGSRAFAIHDDSGYVLEFAQELPP